MTEATEAIESIRDGSRPSELESLTLEFKTEAASPRESLQILADAVVCFASAPTTH